MNWNGKPYHSLDYELKQQFGRKIYKLSLDAAMTCPNRDGTLGSRGCIFCSQGGSGDFAARAASSVSAQIQAAMEQVSQKLPPCPDPLTPRYIAYFQSYTNTYAPAARLRDIFSQAAACPQVAIVSAATRPDCLPPDVVRLLGELNQRKPFWVELGLQTIHPSSARFIRRGYDLAVFEDALDRLEAAGLTVIVHVILGLPGESREMMLETVDYLAKQKAVSGIKLQLLHILKGTDLASLFQTHPFPVFSMDEYIDLVIDCVERLPESMVIHRLTGDGPKSLLIAPMWSGDKKRVLNRLHQRFRERGAWQGRLYSP